jgi:MFS family permease
VGDCRSFLSPEKINHTEELENEVQQYVAFVSIAKAVMESIMPAIFSFFIGAWSDKHGRKPMVAWAALGKFKIWRYSLISNLLLSFSISCRGQKIMITHLFLP